MAESKITIGGKALVISGSDSEGHLQEVADYVNKKLSEAQAAPGYNKMTNDTKIMLLELNMGDDYISAKSGLDEAMTNLASRDKEIYELKRENESLKKELETAKKQVEELQNGAAENAAKIMRLETELKNKK